jgi:hypothetical protein
MATILPSSSEVFTRLSRPHPRCSRGSPFSWPIAWSLPSRQALAGILDRLFLCLEWPSDRCLRPRTLHLLVIGNVVVSTNVNVYTHEH